MKRKFLTGLAVAALCATAALAQEKGGLDQTGPYDPVVGWFKPGIDKWDQPVASLTVDNPNRIFITNSDQTRTRPNAPMLSADGKVMQERSQASTRPREQQPHENMIMVLNGEGRMIENWKQWDKEITFAHNIEISPYDPDRAVWVMDLGHQILKFSNDGKKLLMRLGEKDKPGWDATHFNMPSSIAFYPDGTFIVADGYVNGRIAKFDKNGKYISEFGSKGSGPGQFDLVHSVAIDKQGRIYASDRRNHRIQVFDANGKFIEEWKNVGSPTRLAITEDQYLWMSDADYNRFAKFDLSGKLITYWGVLGANPGEFNNLHNWDVDVNGNLFTADGGNNRIQKFVAKKNADPMRLMGQQYFAPPLKK
ncbi:MAG: 6-bladed beta-propeller [Rhodospirillaceae bacterium]|nr:6-bladed beta-propeller [Rhodospirillaceae bacterium]